AFLLPKQRGAAHPRHARSLGRSRDRFGDQQRPRPRRSCQVRRVRCLLFAQSTRAWPRGVPGARALGAAQRQNQPRRGGSHGSALRRQLPAECARIVARRALLTTPPNTTVLVVDDDRAFCAALAAAFRRRGLAVAVAYNYEDALAEAEVWQPTRAV